MTKRKRLTELTIKDNFMFGAVMIDENNCRGLLERILHIKIGHVEVSKEKSIVYHPEYKGVRLDVYAKDDAGTHYDIEMQVLQKPGIERRSRYYHSQMDMEFLHNGEEYINLPNTYVIFICDFDPFGKKKYCYTFENVCQEDNTLFLRDGRKSIFLSTKGENENEISQELNKFLKFVRSNGQDCEDDFQDEFVEQLQKSIKDIKKSREMEARFMLFQELLNEERTEAYAEGHAEGRAEGCTLLRNTLVSILESKGKISKNLHQKLISESNMDTLSQWIKIAANVDSIENFLKEM